MIPKTDNNPETQPASPTAANGSAIIEELRAYLTGVEKMCRKNVADAKRWERWVYEENAKANAVRDVLSFLDAQPHSIVPQVPLLSAEDFEMECANSIQGDLWDASFSPSYTEKVHLRVSEMRQIANMFRLHQGKALRDCLSTACEQNDALCESAGRKKTHESKGDVAAPSDSQQQMAMPPRVGNAHNNTKDK